MDKDLLEAARDVAAHWREFGIELGFADKVERLGAAANAAQAAELGGTGGWVVMNSARTRYRSWRDGFSVWTADVKAATRYHRRRDAEAVHAEDEDAWTVVELDAEDRPR